jgi:hypothetical protein
MTSATDIESILVVLLGAVWIQGLIFSLGHIGHLDAN